MAFVSSNFVTDRGAFNSITGFVGPAIHRYVTTDDLSVVTTDGYFDAALPGDDQLTNQAATLVVNDLIYVNAADGNVILIISAIGDTAPKVDTLYYLLPAAYNIALAGKAADGGGDPTVVIAAPGVIDTDIVFAQLESSTNAVQVKKVTPTVDTVTVLLSGDPGASTTIGWQALRENNA